MLTVAPGDERPCQRCIKRGLADACQDGVRKKAKYLHDAPPEALIPPSLGGTYNLAGNKANSNHTVSNSSLTGPANYYQTSQSLDMYPQTPSHIQMPHGLGSA